MQQNRETLDGHREDESMWLLLVGICLGVAACTGDPASEAAHEAAVDTVFAASVVAIGDVDGPSDQLFGNIVGLAIDDAGVIYVADRIGSTVRAYDETGGYLGTVGSEGDGPGEFRNLLHLMVDGRGRLFVRGAFRLSVFEHSAGSLFADSVTRTTPAEGGRTDRVVPGRVSDSLYYSPGYFWEGFERRGYYYEVYDGNGTLMDTLLVPPLEDPESTGRANYMVSAQGGRNVDGINRAPFEALPTWDITHEGHIWFTEGSSYEVLEVGPTGDTLRVLRRAPEDRRVPADELRDSLLAFEVRLDSVPVGIEDVRGMSPLARRRTPRETFPEIFGVRVDGAGLVWVERWPQSDASTFDVYDDGERVRTVVVPGSLRRVPSAWLSRDRVVGVVADVATGVERVVVYGLGGM